MIGEGRGGRTLAQALLESERKVDSLEEELDGSRRRRDKIFQSRPREWVEERLTQLAEEDTWGASNWLSVALPADQDHCGPLTIMKERHRVSGFTTIEMVIVLSLFGFVLVSLVGLHLVALSAGTAAETSSIAANLARARMEALLALPRETLREQNNTAESHQIPPGGRTYMVHTTVNPS